MNANCDRRRHEEEMSCEESGCVSAKVLQHLNECWV
jgi:hypothetical protein